MYFGTFAIISGLAAIFLVLSFWSTKYRREHPEFAIIFSGIAALLWMVTTFGAFNLEVGTDIYIEWTFASVGGVITLVSFVLTILNIFDAIKEYAKAGLRI